MYIASLAFVAGDHGLSQTLAASAKHQPESWQVVAPAQAVSSHVVTLARGSEKLRLEACSNAIVRVTYVDRGSHPSGDNPMLLSSACNPAIHAVAFHRSTSQDGNFVFATPLLQVVVSARVGTVRFEDTAGRQLLAELPDIAARQRSASDSSAPQTSSVTDIFLPQSGERFFGLGQHQSGVWNYSGDSVELTQDNTNISIPFFVSDRGYGLLWTNGGASRFNNRFAQRLYLSSKVADSIDYFFVYGPEIDGVIKGYRELTGQAPLFSRSAYGFWQSKNRYETQQQILEAAARYRALHVPIDNIVQDWFWWTRMGSHIFNANYPDAHAMVDQLHQQHFHVMISVWPFFEPGSDNYQAFRSTNHLIYKPPDEYHSLPGTGFYDAFSGEARSMYWQQVDRALFSKGFDAWWLDTTEPETIDRESNLLETATTGMGSGARMEDLFPLMTTTSVYQGQRAATSDKRVFILTRSGAAGMQRNAAAAWSGDLFSTWDAFRRQIPAGLNYSITGLPYWTTDIGGFVSGDPDDPAYRELFIRWFEYGTFCPIFRVHGTRKDNRNELWSYGPKAQAILTHFDELRYRLMPYIYSAAWAVTSKSSTMMRPLVMDFRNDENAGTIGDQFLFGQSLMVSPVTHAGERVRHVYLPEAPGWFDFWTGARISGGRFMDADAPIESIPLHVRAGSIIPIGPALQYADEHPADPIELRVYAGADADYELYEDAGDSYRYENGEYAIIRMHWNDESGTLTIGERQGNFPGMLEQRTFRVVWVRDGHGVGSNFDASPDREIHYDGHAVTVTQTP